MNNLCQKAAFASICTALGLTLVGNLEAKAATFILEPTITFEVIDGGFIDIFDGRGDLVFPGNFDTVVRGTFGESAEFAEVYIRSFDLPERRIISSAIFQADIYSFDTFGLGIYSINPGSLGIFGYVGNARVEASDFEAGVFLNSVDISSLFPGDTISFDVTPFVNQLVSNGDAFAGFGIRALNLGSLTLGGGNFSGISPKLIVKTPDNTVSIPEADTIFGSTIALGLGGLLKRKNSIKREQGMGNG